MTAGKNRAPRMATRPAAAFAALLLAGCSSGHIGEDWQCPLAAGGSCASVAAADPAVPKAGIVQAPASREPIRLLPRDVETKRADLASMETRSCEAGCDFDPFAWLARLFGVDAGGDDGGPASVSARLTDIEAVPSPQTAVPDGDAETSQPADENPDGADDLRTGEVVARIWIAPFVDGNGIYREGAWVRVVLAPAGWRLPR